MSEEFITFAPNYVIWFTMAKILVIDDERAIRNTLKDILEFEGYTVDVAENGRIGLEMALAAKYDLIYTDIKMPEMDGMEMMQAYRKTTNELGLEEAPVVMITGHGTVETAVDALKSGAYDFIVKPLDLNRLLVTTQRAVEHKSLVQETKVLRKKIGARNKMVGESAAIERVREIIEKVAPTEARVMITGANGTGKEVVAHLIHENSARAKKAMVEVNCAAIPSELIESELFGHTKGSFTSAIKDRAGKFEQADGGTLFLDEIGDMSLSAQAKVLRALQENEITRVGSDKPIKVNVRVLAATNKDLKREIAEGRFREDLFHRLNVIPIHVPALDERKDDIPLLVTYFAEHICGEQGWKTKAFDHSAVVALQERSWPGNIRELRNVVERLIILGGETITAEDVTAFA
jgi:DNA-binding NtrC family response regulator